MNPTKHPRLSSRSILLAGLCAALASGIASTGIAAPATALEFSLTPIGRVTNGPPFNLSAAEIVAHDPATQQLFVVNARDRRLDVLDIRNPADPVKVAMVDLSPYGAVVNSVAVHGGLVAVAVEGSVKTSPGTVVLLDASLNVVNAIPSGALPDMVAFSPDGRWLLVANEGEPNTYNDFGSETNGPSIDPEGSVTIIDLATGPANPVVSTATFTAFNTVPIDARIRIYGPNASVAQDLEPEYITISDDSTTAWVTLQENNALAIVNIASGTVTDLVALGFKDHNQPDAGLDASDQDGAINIRPWPLKGIYAPDSIDSYRFHGQTYLVTANEGDAREWPGFREDVRLSTRTLDTTAFPDGAELKRTNNLGRLAVSSVDGDIDGDGDLDEIYSYGARSFSIWTAAGDLVFDSGDQMEQLTAAVFPTRFNASHSNNSFDNRSTSKGPEPEGLVIGRAFGRMLAFVAFERIGGVAVYDITDPFDVGLVDYVNTRNFTGSFNFATSGDLGPEGVAFISADNSPNGKPLVVVAHEVSGSTVIFQLNQRASKREL
jgi:2',3'-cyclic-nucleotide 2'-phosphodiesterase/3'-nucleotidase/5'-nucleotidase